MASLLTFGLLILLRLIIALFSNYKEGRFLKKDFNFKAAERGRKMVETEDSTKDRLFSCENNLPFINDEISE